MDYKQDFFFKVPNKFTVNKLMGWSDGGSRDKDEISSSAWVLKARDEEGKWHIIQAGATFFNCAALSSYEVESKALLFLFRAISDWVAE